MALYASKRRFCYNYFQGGEGAMKTEWRVGQTELGICRGPDGFWAVLQNWALPHHKKGVQIAPWGAYKG